ERSDHALGDIEKVESLPEVEDFSCPYAFGHVFHRFVEEKRSLPTWQEFRDWFFGEARPMFADPFMRAFGWLELDASRKRELGRALQWRIGKLYYSSMREVDLL